MHQKNWALITDDKNVVRLAPCYDFVSSKIYVPNELDPALTLNGKNNKLTWNDLETFAAALQIDPKAAQQALSAFPPDGESRLITLCKTSALSHPLQEKLIAVLQERHKRLQP